MNPNDAARATGQKKQKVTIEGEVFEIGTLVMKSVGRLQAWIDKQPVPPFMEKAKELASGADHETSRFLLAQAQMQEANWPPQIITSPMDASRVLMSKEEGWNLFLNTVLGSARSDLTSIRIAIIAESVTTDQFNLIWMASLGIDAPDVVVAPAQARLCIFTDSGIRDIIRAAVASSGIDADPEKLDEGINAIPFESYGTVLNLTVAGETPEVPKGEMGLKSQSRRSISQNSTRK